MRKVIVFLIFTNFLFSYEELTVDNFDEKIKGKNAIIDFFQESCPKLSATKSITGHTLGASGAIEAVLSVLAIKKQLIFPNFSFSEPMVGLNIHPETKFQRNVNINHVMSNSFGFGGNCSTLIFSKCQ